MSDECVLGCLRRVGLERGSQTPGQQILYRADGMVCDLGEHSAQVEFRIKSIELGRANYLHA